MVVFENAKYTVRGTSKFKKEIRLAKKRGLDIKELYPIVKLLANGATSRKIRRPCFGRKVERSPRVSCPSRLAFDLPN